MKHVEITAKDIEDVGDGQHKKLPQPGGDVVVVYKVGNAYHARRLDTYGTIPGEPGTGEGADEIPL